MNQVARVQSPPVGTQQGNWWWYGQRWVCCPDADDFPCPSFIPPPQGQPAWFPGANGGVTFSTTAPPNPCRGHFWWNGVVLQMFDGAAWVEIGPNVMPQGVTNGSDAAPGQVGEYFQTSTGVTYTAASQTQLVNAGVLQPGDWNCNCAFEPDGWLAGIQFNLSPQPAGFTTDMAGIVGDQTVITGTPVGETNAIVPGLFARALIKVPTLLVFNMMTNFIANGNPGAGSFLFFARRMR